MAYENTPLTVEDDSEEESKKKKLAEQGLGLFAVENDVEAEEQPRSIFAKREEEEGAKSFLERFNEAEDQKAEEKAEQAEQTAEDQKVEPVAESEPPEPIKLPEAEPAPESEAPLEEIGEEEEQVVVQALAEGAKQELAEKPTDPEEDPAEAAGDQAVEQMYDEIIEGKDPEEAFGNVMQELGAEPEPEPEAERPEPEPETPPEPQAERAEEPPEQPPEEPPEEPPPPPEIEEPSEEPPEEPSEEPPEEPPEQHVEVDFNVGPTPRTSAEDVRQPEYRRASPAAMALAGGIIGYLIGRRRGRINTEKKLLPIQTKLEHQVEDLQWSLKKKELAIRRAAAERLKHEADAELTPEQKTAADSIESAAGQRLETLSRAELITMSDKIVIDGSTLRRIYETRLIDEQGLRRLIGEHLSGGDLKKALTHEVVKHETNFEHDASLRGITVPVETSGESTVSGQLTEMIEKAASRVSGSNEDLVYKQVKQEIYDKQHPIINSRMADIILVVTISVLALIVIAVFFLR